MKIKSIRIISTLSMLSLALYGFGCNPFQSAQDKMSEKVAEKMLEGIAKNEGVNMDVDIKGEGGKIVIKDEEGGGEMMFGEEVEIPSDLSDSVMVYPDAKAVSVLRNLGGTESVMMSLQTPDEVSEVIDWYATKYENSGWEKTQTVSISGTEMRSFELDDEQVVVTVGRAEDDDYSVITLNWSVEDSE